MKNILCVSHIFFTILSIVSEYLNFKIDQFLEIYIAFPVLITM